MSLPRLCLLALVLALAPGAVRAAPGVLDDYLRLQVGSFSSAAQARQDARYDTAIWHVVEIWPGNPAERWLYTESWLKDAAAPYVQRISRITANADGTLTARRYTLPEPQQFVGAWREPARFAALAPAALVPVEGCDATLVRAGQDRFEGSTRGADCRNRYKGAAYMLSRLALGPEGMSNWDRGFAADGTQVWGPVAGGYRFEREGAAACNAPVRMLVHGEIRDRAGFLKYVTAIRESGLYEQTGGYYEAITPALEVFEGTPPPTRGVVISRFPCLEKAREFWNSPRYREIVKLREGIAEFEVLVLPVPPKPKYLAD